MKKIIQTIVCLVVCLNLKAQTPGVLDTIEGRNPLYFYHSWFDSSDFYNLQYGCEKDIWRGSNAEIAKYNYTDSTLKIIGVAAIVNVERNDHNPDPPPDNPNLSTDTIPDNWVEQMKLYKPTDSGMVLLASQSYSIRDTAHWMKLRKNYSTHSVGTEYIPIYEVFFDKPYEITDSFYVATTNTYGGIQTYTVPTNTYRYETLVPGSRCWRQNYMIGYYYGSGLQWTHKYESFLWFIFPIIDTVQPVPDTCKVPQGLHVSRQDSSGVHLAWEQGEHNRLWSVAYGRADADVDTFPIYSTPTTSFDITDLTPGVTYAARVRGECFDDSTYSDWSDTVHFMIELAMGIDNLDDARAVVCIQPNPTQGIAMIRASVGILRVEVYDLLGHLILAKNARGTKAEIDVGGWHKGNYVVKAITTQGISTLKLVVE